MIGLIEDDFGAIVSPENDPGALAEVLRRYDGDPERVRREGRWRPESAIERVRGADRRRACRAAARSRRAVSAGERPLRALFVDEGVLGHRTLTAQLRAALADDPEVDATFETIPPPGRPERLFLRRAEAAGDADLFELRWRLRWSRRARRILRRHARTADVAFVNTQASALLSRGPMRRLPHGSLGRRDREAVHRARVRATARPLVAAPGPNPRPTRAAGDGGRGGDRRLDRVERRRDRAASTPASSTPVGDAPSRCRCRLVGRGRNRSEQAATRARSASSSSATTSSARAWGC